MLAAHRDQENLVHSRQVPTKDVASKNIAPRTPGARYPKTPLKIPLNDENGAQATGAKGLLPTGKNTMGKKQPTATPAGTRRAPLGNKTTNAKARAVAPGVTVKGMVQEFEKSQVKQPSHQKPKPKALNTAPVKFEVMSDVTGLSDDVEYAPPKPQDLPYESDVFPDGVLTFEGLKPENILKGYYERYHDPVDDDGIRVKDKKFEEQLQKALKEGDERILKDIENTDWSVSDVPETKVLARLQKPQDALAPKPDRARAIANRTALKQYPPTLSSRRAVSALSMNSTVRERKPRAPLEAAMQPKRKLPFLLSGRKAIKPAQPTKTPQESAIAEVASRNTLGYSKGRSASSAVKTNRGPLARSASGASVSSDRSDVTITPANFLKFQESKVNKSEESPRPQFLGIFDVHEDSDDDSHLTTTENFVDEFEDFELKLDDE